MDMKGGDFPEGQILVPVISIGRPIGIILEYRNGRNLWVVLVDGVRHVDFTEVLGQFNMLCWRHLLIPEKDDLMCHERIVNSLCTVGCDVAEIDIDFGAQGWSETFNLHVYFPASMADDHSPSPYCFSGVTVLPHAERE
jgi:hypothetical protein